MSPEDEEVALGYLMAIFDEANSIPPDTLPINLEGPDSLFHRQGYSERIDRDKE